MAFWNTLFRNFFVLIWNLNSLFINCLLYKQSKPKSLLIHKYECLEKQKLREKLNHSKSQLNAAYQKQ
jgi:hypothetical protein